MKRSCTASENRVGDAGGLAPLARLEGLGEEAVGGKEALGLNPERVRIGGAQLLQVPRVLRTGRAASFGSLLIVREPSPRVG